MKYFKFETFTILEIGISMKYLNKNFFFNPS